jgi:endonuclease YncB( thermonuclease family)
MTRLLAIIVALALAVPASAGPSKRTIRVIDGDTIKASNLRAPVRLLGYDAPELHKSVRSGYRCEAERQLGLQAKAELERILAPSPKNKVVIKRTIARDEWGRRLARVTSNGRDVGQLLIARGLAKPWKIGTPRPRWC